MTSPPLPRIGIDGYNLALPEGTGVATYARVLGRTVAAMGHPVDLLFGMPVARAAPRELRESLFFARLGHYEGLIPQKLTVRGAITRALTLPGKRDMIEVPVTGTAIVPDIAARLPPFERLFTYAHLFQLGARYFRRYGRFLTVRVPQPPAIMHWTYPIPVRLEGAANIYTVHDLVPLRLPHTTLEDKRYYHRLIGTCLSEADRICTVSETSRDDILSLFPVAPDKVVNTYQSADLVVDAGADEADEARRLRQLFDLERGGYFLFFAAIEPKKNLGRLIEAYLGADIQTPLVIVGKEAWHADQELRLIRAQHGRTISAAERIRRFDYLPRPLLALLVKGARAVCFPSLYEGFGLPALEAMSVGTPVLASRGGSLPEIVGPRGLMVDPYDVAAMTAALVRLDQDAELRASLSAEGLAQAANFSDARYRDRLRALYQPLL